MNNRVEQVRQEALQAIAQASGLEELQQVRNTYLSKKGAIQELMSLMRNLSRSCA